MRTDNVFEQSERNGRLDMSDADSIAVEAVKYIHIYS